MARPRNDSDPILELLLQEIRVHEDEQLEALRTERVNLKRILANLKSEKESRWDKYLTIDRKTAYDKLFRQKADYVSMYDQIVSEG